MAIVAGDSGHIAAHTALDAEHTAWTAFTPTFSATGTAPNVGTTGSRSGRYKQVGKTVFWQITITTGGTGISAGSGTYLVAWPGSLAPPTPGGGFAAVGSGWIYTGTFITMVPSWFSSTNMQFVLTSGAGYMGSTNSPFNSTGYVLTASGLYETV